MATLKNTIINDSGFLKLPAGTDAQRPTGEAGMMRYNTSSNTVEAWDPSNSEWRSVEVRRPSLFTFTTHTFTSAGSTGPTGPNLSQLQSAYSSTTWASNTAYLNVTSQGIQNWTVPATGIYEFDLAGAAGGSGTLGGANGGRAIGRISLEQGQIIYIVVGQTTTDGNGGWNGGGPGGRGGGGASDVRIGGTGLNNRVIVAGGGGGGPNYSGSDRGPAGPGGGLTGGGGYGVTTASGYGLTTGGGGTQSSGGSGYDGGSSGSLGQGGTGGSGVGGGGGGGYYGGGGGGYFTPGVNTATAGGGGSSYYSASFTNTSTTAGFRSGDGYVSITLIG